MTAEIIILICMIPISFLGVWFLCSCYNSAYQHYKSDGLYPFTEDDLKYSCRVFSYVEQGGYGCRIEKTGRGVDGPNDVIVWHSAPFSKHPKSYKAW